MFPVIQQFICAFNLLLMRYSSLDTAVMWTSGCKHACSCPTIISASITNISHLIINFQPCRTHDSRRRIQKVHPTLTTLIKLSNFLCMLDINRMTRMQAIIKSVQLLKAVRTITVGTLLKVMNLSRTHYIIVTNLLQNNQSTFQTWQLTVCAITSRS